MIETAAKRRAVGDWRGACAAADIDLFFDPDSVRTLYGAAAAESLTADLRALAPDLLRWHLPRCGHGPGRLLAGLLVPLAEYAGVGTTLTLAAATPEFALAAGERVVLTLLEGSEPGRHTAVSPAGRAVSEAVHRRSAERFDLRGYRMFWDAECAADLSALCSGDGDGAGDETILRMQDEGRAVDAWTAAGWDVAFGRPRTTAHQSASSSAATVQERERLLRWLASVPVNLPGLARRVREALPGAGRAVIRCGGGTIALSGFDGARRLRADVVPPRQARALRAGTSTVPDAAWARPIDADLLRFGALAAHELHPLVAKALAPAGEVSGPAEPREWRYNTALGIEAQFANIADSADGGRRPVILVRCGADLHRVARIEGRWQAVDHDDHAAREMLLARLGGPANPCRSAARHLGDGRHVIELVARLLEHGRASEATRLLHEHADTVVAPEEYVLPDGTTVGQALDVLRENTLRLRLIRAGAQPPRDDRTIRALTPSVRDSRPRKGEPARPKIPR